MHVALREAKLISDMYQLLLHNLLLIKFQLIDLGVFSINLARYMDILGDHSNAKYCRYRVLKLNYNKINFIKPRSGPDDLFLVFIAWEWNAIFQYPFSIQYYSFVLLPMFARSVTNIRTVAWGSLKINWKLKIHILEKDYMFTEKTL